jgi:hypothetical protein
MWLGWGDNECIQNFGRDRRWSEQALDQVLVLAILNYWLLLLVCWLCVFVYRFVDRVQKNKSYELNSSKDILNLS